MSPKGYLVALVFLVLLCGLMILGTVVVASNPFPENRIGDSITRGGLYVEDVEVKGTKYRVFRWSNSSGSAMQIIELKENH